MQQFRQVSMKFIFFASLVLFFLTLSEGCSTVSIFAEKISLQRSDEHFEFYSAKSDVMILDALEKTLEVNYQKITGDLGTTFTTKVKVYIYPDIETFHKAVGVPKAPDWLVGIGGLGQLKIVSPLNPGGAHSYNFLMKNMVHEFVHVASWNLRGNADNVPKWLSEGIAYYEADQIEENGLRILRSRVSQGRIPSLYRMEVAGSVDFGDLGGYLFGYTIIEYMVKKYGMKTVAELIKNPELLEKILGIT